MCASVLWCTQATPPELLQRGIYSEIAVPLKGGAWREASLVLLSAAISLTQAEEAAAAEGDDVLGLSNEKSAHLKVKRFARGLSGMRRSLHPRRFASSILRSTRLSLRKSNERTAHPVQINVDSAPHDPQALDDEEFLQI